MFHLIMLQCAQTLRRSRNHRHLPLENAPKAFAVNCAEPEIGFKRSDKEPLTNTKAQCMLLHAMRQLMDPSQFNVCFCFFFV